MHKYVTDDKLYRIDIAPNEAMVREQASQDGLPANQMSATVPSSVRRPQKANC